MATLTCHASGDTSSTTQTDTIIIYKNDKKVAGVVFGSNNKGKPWTVKIDDGENYKIDITRTCYAGSSIPLPIFWRGIIEIHNTSGVDAELYMKEAHNPFDTMAHMEFHYLGMIYTFDQTSHVVIDDHGPNPPAPPVVYTRQIITDHGQFAIPENVQVWHEDEDPSRQGYFNCPKYVHNTQCLPGMSSSKDSMATSVCTETIRRDSQGNIDLMSLSYDWTTGKKVGPFE